MAIGTPSIRFGRRINIASRTITTALTGDLTSTGGSAGISGLGGATYLGFTGVFTYGSGGTTAAAYIQTSFDGGTTWFDVANMAFTTTTLTKVGAITLSQAAAAPATPTDGTLASNTINQGLLGDRVRIKLTTTGTYAGGTTLKIDMWTR